MFGIYHRYDVDGGFGDAIGKQDLIAFCESEEIAKKYCEMHDRTQVYDSPYSDLYKGTLAYEELDVPTITEENVSESPWNEDYFNGIW